MSKLVIGDYTSTINGHAIVANTDN